MENLPGYDGWKLSYPSSWDAEPCEHECIDCDGSGKLWLDDAQGFSETDPCDSCFEASGYCDGACEPDYEEPERDND